MVVVVSGAGEWGVAGKKRPSLRVMSKLDTVHEVPSHLGRPPLGTFPPTPTSNLSSKPRRELVRLCGSALAPGSPPGRHAHLPLPSRPPMADAHANPRPGATWASSWVKTPRPRTPPPAACSHSPSSRKKKSTKPRPNKSQVFPFVSHSLLPFLLEAGSLATTHLTPSQHDLDAVDQLFFLATHTTHTRSAHHRASSR
jgi:hypothetical protein